MKKLLALITSALLMVGAVGCASNDNDKSGSEEKVLKIAGLDGGYGREHWDALAKAFEEKNEGVKVELTLEKNIAEILRPQIQSGDVPDIIYLSVGSEGGLTDTLISEKAIVEITDLLDMKVPGEEVTVGEKIIPGFTDTLVTNPYGDGKTYLAPLFYSPCGLFYNASLFANGGYELPETFDEMFALGEKSASEGSALFTYPTTGYFDAFFYALLNEVAGAETFAKLMNYDVEAWKSSEVRQAFDVVGELAKYTHENTVAQANGNDFAKNQQLILDNKALFIPNGTWLPGEMENAPRADGFEWGFTALPKVTEGGDSYSFTFFEQMFIPAGAANEDLAKEFMAYMYSDEAAKTIYELGGAVQPITTASSLIGEEDPNKLYYSVYDNGAKAAMGTFASATAVEGVDLVSADGILFGTINSVVNGTKTVDQWYNEVIKAVEAISAAQ